MYMYASVFWGASVDLPLPDVKLLSNFNYAAVQLCIILHA